MSCPEYTADDVDEPLPAFLTDQLHWPTGIDDVVRVCRPRSGGRVRHDGRARPRELDRGSCLTEV